MRLVVNKWILKMAKWLILNKDVLNHIDEDSWKDLYDIIYDQTDFGKEDGVYLACKGLGENEGIASIAKPRTNLKQVTTWILECVPANVAVRISTN